MMYVHNIIFGTQSAINNVAWSLEVEFQFYILAPFLANLFRIRQFYIRRGIIIGLIVIFSIINVMVSDLAVRYRLSVLYYAQFFFTGFLLLDIYLNEWQQNPKKRPIWDIISIVAWFSIFIILYIGKQAKVMIVIPMFIAYCAAFSGTISNRFFCHSWIYTIGGMCYTIYLYHCAIISAFGRLIIKSGVINHMPVWMGIILSGILLAPITLFICTVLFVTIEKPCMKKDWYRNIFNLRLAKAEPADKK